MSEAPNPTEYGTCAGCPLLLVIDAGKLEATCLHLSVSLDYYDFWLAACDESPFEPHQGQSHA